MNWLHGKFIICLICILFIGLGCSESTEIYLQESAKLKLHAEGPDFEGLKFFSFKMTLNESRDAIAVYTDDKILTICELPELNLRWQIKTPHKFTLFEFIGNSNNVVGASVSLEKSDVSVVDGNSGKIIKHVTYPADSIVDIIRAKDTALIFISPENSMKLDVVDAKTSEKVFSILNINITPSFDLNLKGGELAIAVKYLKNHNKGIAIIDVKNGLLKSFIPISENLNKIAFSASGKQLAIAYENYTEDVIEEVVEVWERIESKDKWKLKKHVKGNIPLTFSQNGDILAYVWPEQNNCSVKLLDLRTDQITRCFRTPTHDGAVTYTLAWNPFRIAFFNAGGNRIEVHSLENQKTYKIKGDSFLPPIFFSRDSHLIVVSGDGFMRTFKVPN